jgi:hypothetical protein
MHPHKFVSTPPGLNFWLPAFVACSQAGKPGARKRKLGAAAEPGSMDVLPSSLIMSMGFKPPKVRHLG